MASRVVSLHSLDLRRFGTMSPRTLRCWLCVALALAVLAMRTSPAAAQMSVKYLTEGAVTDTEGPHSLDVSDAIQKFSERDYESARKLLVEARKKTPKLAPVEVMLSQLFFASNQPSIGRGELEKAVKNNPDDPEAYLLLGELALQEGRLTEAGLVFNKSAEVAAAFKDNAKRSNGFKIRIYAGLASVDEALGRWKEAKVHLNNWVKADATSANAHFRLGRALFENGDTKEAYTEFQTAAKNDEKLPSADVTMANLYWSAGDKTKADKTKAEQFLKRAEDTAKKDVNSQLALANVLLSMNRIGDAQKHADEAVKIDPKNMDAKLTAGILARMQGDFKTAEKLLDQVHNQSPSNFLAINHLALVLIEGDDASMQRALEFAEINARQNPKNAEALATLGWIYLKNGKEKEAEQILGPLAGSGSASSELVYYLAELLKSKDRVPEAVKLLDNVLNTERPFAYRKQAQALLRELKTAKEDASKKGGKKGSDKAKAKGASKQDD